MTGKLEAIWLKRMEGSPMDPKEQATLQVNKGLVGNFNQGGKRQGVQSQNMTYERGCFRRHHKEPLHFGELHS